MPCQVPQIKRAQKTETKKPNTSVASTNTVRSNIYSVSFIRFIRGCMENTSCSKDTSTTLSKAISLNEISLQTSGTSQVSVTELDDVGVCDERDNRWTDNVTIASANNAALMTRSSSTTAATTDSNIPKNHTASARFTTTSTLSAAFRRREDNTTSESVTANSWIMNREGMGGFTAEPLNRNYAIVTNHRWDEISRDTLPRQEQKQVEKDTVDADAVVIKEATLPGTVSYATIAANESQATTDTQKHQPESSTSMGESSETLMGVHPYDKLIPIKEDMFRLQRKQESQVRNGNYATRSSEVMP